MSVLSRFPPGEMFIETGLGHGQSLVAAVDSRVYRSLASIEIDPALVARMREVMLPASVQIYEGSSLDWLPKLCDPQLATVFWLDAHFSAGLYSSDAAYDRAQLDIRVGECPLLAELAIIRAVDWQTPPVILIDDAVCFEAAVYTGHHAAYTRTAYPTREDIEAALPPLYRCTRCDDGTGEFFVCEAR